MVGGKNRRTAQKELAVAAQLEVDHVDGQPHAAEAKMVPAIDKGRSRGLGQAVAFQNQQSGAVEKLGDFMGKRRATRDQETAAIEAQALAQFAQHQLVREAEG